MRTLTIEGIMDRLSRICRHQKCCVTVRPKFPSGPGKWYVSLSGVDVAFMRGGSTSCITADCDSGATPEDAIRNVWNGVLALANNQTCALRRYNCPSNVPLPGDEPQVWVRWNSQLDDWVDVQPPESVVPTEKLRSYKEQYWIDNL